MNRKCIITYTYTQNLGRGDGKRGGPLNLEASGSMYILQSKHNFSSEYEQINLAINLDFKRTFTIKQNELTIAVHTIMPFERFPSQRVSTESKS